MFFSGCLINMLLTIPLLRPQDCLMKKIYAGIRLHYSLPAINEQHLSELFPVEHYETQLRLP